jgi:hypothetical protein
MDIQELIDRANKKISTSEYGACKFMGVSNVSRSDLDDVIFYAGAIKVTPLTNIYHHVVTYLQY